MEDFQDFKQGFTSYDDVPGFVNVFMFIMRRNQGAAFRALKQVFTQLMFSEKGSTIIVSQFLMFALNSFSLSGPRFWSDFKAICTSLSGAKKEDVYRILCKLVELMISETPNIFTREVALLVLDPKNKTLLDAGRSRLSALQAATEVLPVNRSFIDIVLGIPQTHGILESSNVDPVRLGGVPKLSTRDQVAIASYLDILVERHAVAYDNVRNTAEKWILVCGNLVQSFNAWVLRNKHTADPVAAETIGKLQDIGNFMFTLQEELDAFAWLAFAAMIVAHMANLAKMGEDEDDEDKESVDPKYQEFCKNMENLKMWTDRNDSVELLSLCRAGQSNQSNVIEAAFGALSAPFKEVQMQILQTLQPSREFSIFCSRKTSSATESLGIGDMGPPSKRTVSLPVSISTSTISVPVNPVPASAAFPTPVPVTVPSSVPASTVSDGAPALTPPVSTSTGSTSTMSVPVSIVPAISKKPVETRNIQTGGAAGSGSTSVPVQRSTPAPSVSPSTAGVATLDAIKKAQLRAAPLTNALAAQRNSGSSSSSSSGASSSGSKPTFSTRVSVSAKTTGTGSLLPYETQTMSLTEYGTIFQQWEKGWFKRVPYPDSYGRTRYDIVNTGSDLVAGSFRPTKINSFEILSKQVKEFYPDSLLGQVMVTKDSIEEYLSKSEYDEEKEYGIVWCSDGLLISERLRELIFQEENNAFVIHNP